VTGVARRRLLSLPLVPLSALPLAGAVGDPTPFRLPRLVIATGGTGGVYYRLGQALAAAARDRWSTDASVLATAASIANLRLVAVGAADVGFTAVDSAALAWHGQEPFTEPLPLAALAGLYDDYLQVVTLAKGPIQALGDLPGRRVSTGAAGSGTEIVAARVLRAAGMSVDHDIARYRMAAAESAEALRARAIDAFFFTGGLPTPAVARLAGQVPIRVLSVGEVADQLQALHGEVYVRRSLPARTYGLPDEVDTVAIPNVLVVRRDMPPATATALTALLFDSRARLDAAHTEASRLNRRSALATFPIPMHPGAARYYRDAKPLIPGR